VLSATREGVKLLLFGLCLRFKAFVFCFSEFVNKKPGCEAQTGCVIALPIFSVAPKIRSIALCAAGVIPVKSPLVLSLETRVI